MEKFKLYVSIPKTMWDQKDTMHKIRKTIISSLSDFRVLWENDQGINLEGVDVKWWNYDAYYDENVVKLADAVLIIQPNFEWSHRVGNLPSGLIKEAKLASDNKKPVYGMYETCSGGLRIYKAIFDKKQFMITNLSDTIGELAKEIKRINSSRGVIRYAVRGQDHPQSYYQDLLAKFDTDLTKEMVSSFIGSSRTPPHGYHYFDFRTIESNKSSSSKVILLKNRK